MPVTTITRDTEALTLRIVAEVAAPVSRLWEAYADPRQFEQFWAPAERPATVIRHDMYPGGISSFFVSGPGSEKSWGYWEVLNVNHGQAFEVRNGFAHDGGAPNPAMPTMRMVFQFAEITGGSRVELTTHFNSREAFETLIEMGIEAGTSSAMRQLDAVVTDLQSYAAEVPTAVKLIGKNQVRVSRILRGSVEQVWEAHHDPASLQRWFLGPDGWELVVVKVAREIDEHYRYEWAPTTAVGEHFGMTGVLLESHPPFREVSTEAMIGVAGPPARNELTLTPVPAGTLLTLFITYPSAEVREMALATGMIDGMEATYSRLEREALVA